MYCFILGTILSVMTVRLFMIIIFYIGAFKTKQAEIQIDFYLLFSINKLFLFIYLYLP